MTEERARRIARDEQLTDIVWFEKPVNYVNSVAVYRDSTGWKVSTTDERAVELAVEKFDTLDLALGECVARSRAGKAASN
ncbi:MAG: hypothetical protein ACRCSP_06490 [Rhodoglobus sp.]